MSLRRRPPTPSGSTTDPLGVAIDAAISGRVQALYEWLTRRSGLPGVRANAELVLAFASHVVTRGKRADSLARSLATLDPDRAPGGTALEILPMCGVAAIGARAAADPRVLSVAEDLRFRVRDEVPKALVRIGAVRGEELAGRVSGWMNGFFQAAAVLLALSDQAWLSTFGGEGALVLRMDEAFELARAADRSAERYPGYKALVVLSTAPGVFAARFGPPIFDRLVAYSSVKEPVLREAILKSVEGGRLAKRFASDVERVRKALEASAPVRRDPRSFVGPTRGRGKRRQR
jgi:hypothetical protein